MRLILFLICTAGLGAAAQQAACANQQDETAQSAGTLAASNDDDPTTGLTLSGRSQSVDSFLASLQTEPHRWFVVKRWIREDGSHSLRLRWPGRPAPSDVASIVTLVQTAQENGLAVSDTKIIDTQP